LRQGFQEIAVDDIGRCALVDGSRDQQTVQRAILDVVEERLGVSL